MPEQTSRARHAGTDFMDVVEAQLQVNFAACVDKLARRVSHAKRRRIASASASVRLLACTVPLPYLLASTCTVHRKRKGGGGNKGQISLDAFAFNANEIQSEAAPPARPLDLMSVECNSYCSVLELPSAMSST
eukprot:1869811-Pleurochrysis_carterae.AAC.3